MDRRGESMEMDVVRGDPRVQGEIRETLLFVAGFTVLSMPFRRMAPSSLHFYGGSPLLVI